MLTCSPSVMRVGQQCPFLTEQLSLKTKRLTHADGDVYEGNWLRNCVPANPVCMLCPETQATNLVWLNRRYLCPIDATSV